jgi:uncharacterized membrane protein HdeD (DUF308 family)
MKAHEFKRSFFAFIVIGLYFILNGFLAFVMLFPNPGYTEHDFRFSVAIHIILTILVVFYLALKKIVPE